MRTEEDKRLRSDFNPVVFTQPGSKLSKKFVSILPKGGILFSSGLVHAEQLTQYKFCILAYDPAIKAIFLHFTNDNEREGIIKLTHRETKNTSLQCGSFFKYFNLDTVAIAGRYNPEKHTLKRQGEWLAVFLDQPLRKG